MKPLSISLKKQVLNQLTQIQKNTLREIHVVLLPDFFVDHFLILDEYKKTTTDMKQIVNQGGGNLPGIPQRIQQGGNAANTALALTRLGIKTHLICRTDPLGAHLLQFFLGKHGVDLTHVKTDGKLAITTAMEFGKNHVNVMIGDTGSVADFSFNTLDEQDHDLIASADLVGVVNWTLNHQGTKLAQDVFKHAKKHNKKTFFDSGDPTLRKNEITELKKTVLTTKELDIFGLNENELRQYSGCTSVSTEETLLDAAHILKKQMHARIDLHTANFSCTVTDTCTVVPAIPVHSLKRTTGAGDAWNAGDIFAELLGFHDEERLLFANTLAAWYISSPDSLHPTLSDLIAFLQTQI